MYEYERARKIKKEVPVSTAVYMCEDTDTQVFAWNLMRLLCLCVGRDGLGCFREPSMPAERHDMQTYQCVFVLVDIDMCTGKAVKSAAWRIKTSSSIGWKCAWSGGAPAEGTSKARLRNKAGR